MLHGMARHGFSCYLFALFSTALQCLDHCTALQITALHCTALHFTALHCTLLQYNVVNNAVQCHDKLCHIALHDTAAHHTVLHCPVLCSNMTCQVTLHCSILRCSYCIEMNSTSSFYVILYGMTWHSIAWYCM